MIEVTLNQPEFEYDIHSLIKAFYPSEYVGVSAEKKEYDEPVTSRMHVEYTDAAITLRWQQGETMPAAERTFAVDALGRPETKNRLKQNLYELLSEATGQHLPWGTLTGIRPTKIPMKLLEEGKSRDEIYAYMKQTYFASDEKIPLRQTLQRGSSPCFPRSIMTMDTVCILEFRSVRRPVCIARLPPIRLHRGRSVWISIWMRWSGR